MNNFSSDNYVLITGGSCGIGKAIAIECAKRDMNLLLVALPGKELQETATQIVDNYNVRLNTFAIDLTTENAHRQVFEWCENNHYQVNVLINNAGLAGTNIFSETSPEYSDQRILLNVRALVLLTRSFLPKMLKMESANIVNISSMSAFYSIGYKSVYAATKAFVLSFSKAIQQEIRGTSVRVTVVCPNGVRTNPDTYARIDTHGLLSKLLILSPEKIAEITINQMIKGKLVVIPGFYNRLLLFLTKLVPSNARDSWATNEFRKELNVPNRDNY